MKAKLLVTLILTGTFFLCTQSAQAGAVRYAGEKITQGSTAVAGLATNGVQAAGDGMVAGGEATGGALKTGVKGIAEGAKATPGLAVRGVKATGKGIAKALW